MNGYNNILGNDSLIDNLKSTVRNNRINHAYIFDGESGMGKMTIAKAFAKTLNCVEGGDQPCGKCMSCKTFDSDNNPDIFYISEQKGIKVDTIRQQINQNIITKPFSYKYKIFIIKDAHTMNVQAQNALLKTLEEPPEYVIFLLLSCNYNMLLTTILSRCVLFKMRQLPQPLLKNYLLEQGFDSMSAETMSHYACGVVGRALTLQHSETFQDLLAFAFKLCEELKDYDLIEMYKAADSLKDKKDDFDTLLQLMYYIFRDALVFKTTGADNRLIHTMQIDKIKKICNSFSRRQLLKSCLALENARVRYSRKGDFQFTVEELFYKIKEK